MNDEDPVRWSDARPPPELLALVRDASRPPPLPPVLRASVRASVLRAARPWPLQPPFVAGLAAVVIVAIGIVLWRVLPIDPEDRSASRAGEPAIEADDRALDEASNELGHAPAERVVVGDDGERAVVRRVGGGEARAIEPAPVRREPSRAEPVAIEAAAADEGPDRELARARDPRRRTPSTAPTPPEHLDPSRRGAGGDIACDAFSGECERREPSTTLTAPQGWGTLTVQTIPWARVFLDGRDTGRTTPIREMRVPAGRHVLGLRGADGVMHTMHITIGAGERQRIARQL